MTTVMTANASQVIGVLHSYKGVKFLFILWVFSIIYEDVAYLLGQLQSHKLDEFNPFGHLTPFAS